MRGKIVSSGRQNTKYKTGRIFCFVFRILSTTTNDLRQTEERKE